MTTPAKIYHAATSIQEQLECLKEMLCDQFGDIYQIHDVSTATRRLVSQRSFIAGDGLMEWANEWRTRLNLDRDTALELVNQDDGHFIVAIKGETNATSAGIV